LKEKDLVVEEEVVVSKVVVQKDRDHLVGQQVAIESIVWADRKEFQDQHSNFFFSSLIVVQEVILKVQL
jgi:hypothetical protein